MSITATDRPCAICGREPDDATYLRVWHRDTPQGPRDLCDGCERAHPELRFAVGRMCHFHFDACRLDWHSRPSQLDVDQCPACILANELEAARVQRECTIDPDQPYGEHIALTCRNHPELTWTTKNIDFIGARSIFFASGRTAPYPDECSCSARDLIVVKR
jgi:hypothetical protein